MRFRSIRELAADDSGKVLADLKPVWLMSPLSVSDTLPLEAGYFDVVIFDEASQIPVEDAVPALYRSHQVIVVGDEMQLPPTKFFAAGNTDDETLVLEEEEEKIELSMEADSFLTQSAINLPSTMLGWHYNRDRKMIMNFGPINQRGGEKRLNVIFSRAKEHMAIVSSILYSDVKNEYNDGANSLRLFLQYAEAFSRGDRDHARRILTNLNPEAKKALSRPSSQDVIIEQLAEGLRERGWLVDSGVGQSRFRCDLAARDPQTAAYALAIFVDLEERVRSAGLTERSIFQPRVLRSFGWRFAHVLTKDWFHDPQGVLDRLERQMETDETEELPVAPEAPTPKVELRGSPISEDLLTNESAPETEPPASPIDNSTESSETASAPEPTTSKLSPPVERPAFDPSLIEDGRPYLFELREGSSNKFWEITRSGTVFTTRHGRIGTTGQSQSKNWPNEAACRREAGKLVREKMRKGYNIAEA